MAKHLQELTVLYDEMTGKILASQLLECDDPRFGAFVLYGYHTDTRGVGERIAELSISYLNPHSRYHLDERVRTAILNAFVFETQNQRPDGCIDLSGCNFASPPDTAFMVNHMLQAWRLLEKYDLPESRWLREPMLSFMTKCGEGIARGGFHTPNHRWAIASCLKHLAKIADRPEFSQRADQYLFEGLDVDENGEFAERSVAGYNKVNDDCMILLYLATGEERFLDAACANLELMKKFLEPDNSLFTNNSTRQDRGTKAYPDGYYELYLLAGYLRRNPAYGAMAEFCYRQSRLPRETLRALPWLLLYDDLDGYGAEEPFDPAMLEHYNAHMKASRIARIRSGDKSLTVLEDKANFFYFQHGAMPMYMVIYSNLCDRRNFMAQSIESIENGYRLKAHANSWYYLPFYPEKPATTDWWAMDNPNTRQRFQETPLDTTVDVTMTEDGVDVHIHTEGIDKLPLRVELGFPEGCRLRHECFLMDGVGGGSMVLAGGTLEVTGPQGDVITVSQGFAEHGCTERSSMGGAFAQSDKHFTVYLTAYTPVDKVIHFGTKPFAKKDLLPWEEKREE